MGIAPSTNQTCTDLCSKLSFTSDFPVTPESCVPYSAGDSVPLTGGQAAANCAAGISTSVGICRVNLTIQTSNASSTYVEVWLPNDNSSSWNGRTMNTDNGGLNGCVHYVDMQYVAGKGFAAIGDNGGHDSGAFDGTWMYENNEVILDWVYRARHASVNVGKQVVDQFYGTPANKSYYLGCSTGGQQGLHSAQNYPADFDGIIAGSSAADYNHLQDWSGRFVTFTGTGTDDPRFLTLNQWLLVQSAILNQCDAPIDGVNDGILEDPSLCQFNASVLACPADNSTTSCLSATQITTVENVFSELDDASGNLIYPALQYGSEIDAYRLLVLSGSVQTIAEDWFRDGVWNDSSWNPYNLNQTDYAQADSEDVLHGNVSTFSGDLSAFEASGGKMIMYHGLADPLVTGANSQRYYLKVAQAMGLDYTAIDPFMRFFRISGMAHCGIGGIAGAGAWMFGQSLAASPGEDNIVDIMVNWVEQGTAPDTITGTKFYNDVPSAGVEFNRSHCRFPYRTTYVSGDSTLPTSWNCTFINDWQQCGPGALPHLCSANGSFT